MAQQKSSQWNVGRFIKTLCYFGVIPFWGTGNPIQRLFMRDLNPTTPHPNLDPEQPETKVVFDFRQISTDLSSTWGAVDDVVMGGVSESGIQLVNGVALFSGNVSTSNAGGFASVRTRNFAPPLDLTGYQGLELRIKGDGKRYKFMLRNATQWDGVAYCYSFDTVADTWIDVRIPFSAFVPIFRARTVSNPQPLDLQHIYALQLMLSKFEYDGALNPKFSAGLFELWVQSVKAYRHMHMSSVS
jgi:hypothetical protein